jgi:hypothetical protein
MAAFVEVRKEGGVDEASNGAPAWMMVPKPGYNVVFLQDGAKLTVQPTGTGHIEMLEVTSDSSSVAKASARVRGSPDAGQLLMTAIKLRQSHRLFLVTPKQRGKAALEATGGKGPPVKLEISVLEKKEVKIAFNFVRFIDPQTKTEKRLTDSKPGDEKAWLDDMNRIYVNQANIYLKWQKADWVNSPSDFAGLIEKESRLKDAKDAKIFSDIASQRDTSAGVFNFFLAKDVEHYQREAGTFGFTRSDLRSAFCDDVDWQPACLAHELGHFLGLGHGGPKQFLMSQEGAQTKTLNERGNKLSRKEILTINPL